MVECVSSMHTASVQFQTYTRGWGWIRETEEGKEKQNKIISSPENLNPFAVVESPSQLFPS